MPSKYQLNMANMVGQCYDGASNMQGEFDGLQKLVREIAQDAIYIHCYAHRLNLVLVEIAKTKTQIKKFFGIVQSLAVFVGTSPKQNAKFDSELTRALDDNSESEASSDEFESDREAEDGQRLPKRRRRSKTQRNKRLHKLSETRWACRWMALDAIKYGFGSLVKSLGLIGDGSSDAKISPKQTDCCNLSSPLNSF